MKPEPRAATTGPTAAGDSDPPPVSGTTGTQTTVAQVTYSLIAGGSEMFAFKLASGLNRQQFRSVMVALDKGGALEPEITSLGIPYRILRRKPGLDWQMTRLLHHWFREQNVKVVHTHHFAQLLYAAPAAKWNGARLIHTEHSVKHYESRRRRWALRLLSSFCDKVLAVGTDVARVLRDEVGIAPHKLAIIRAGVDPQMYEYPRDDARRLLGLRPEDRVAVIVARLSPEKNHELLIRAFAEVVKTVANTRLLIVGDGPEEATIQAQIEALGLQDAVRLLGLRRDIPAVLAASDVFALSSTREGLPIAVLEAMAAGLPVVATAVGDLPVVVLEGKTGLVVRSQDSSGLARALADILSDADWSVRLGKAGREIVERQYSLEAMVRQHEALYFGSRQAPVQGGEHGI